MSHTTQDLHKKFEPTPDPKTLTGNISGDLPHGVNKDVDYEPHPDRSLKVSPEHQRIIKCITNLYSGSCSEDDMKVYAEKSIYDDPWSYCDTRYKIAGQWWGLPRVFSKLQTLKTEVVSDKEDEIVFKMRHEYTPKLLSTPKAVDSLVSLGLDGDGKVRYHKDMWNEKDYSHDGLGKVFKKLNGDQLTRITQPPADL